jgi:hypothetical protein
MRKLNIGTEKYTQVFAADNPDFGANHAYIVKRTGDSSEEAVLGAVYFQKGPIKENGVNGCMNEDLITMVIDRLEGLLWLRKRTMDREARGVEGTHTV